MKKENNCLVTICGPSLGGKSILANLLADSGFNKVVSTTTRNKRDGEVHGSSYWFVSKEEFLNEIKNDNMVEYIIVNEQYYGVSKKAIKSVLNKGNCVSVLEPNGAKELTKFCEENNITLIKVFINNPQEELFKRFLGRFKEDRLASEEVYAKRLHSMIHEEPKNWIEPAYNGFDKYDLIFDSFNNDNQKQVVEKILQFAQEKIEKKSNPKQLRLKIS